jgi:NADH:ubiquinone oxidoreductase subunit F (NADH-binding)
MTEPGPLLSPSSNLAAYRAAGGGIALDRARTIGPDAVIAEIRAAGLRGRGGAGFPTAIKWAGVRAEGGERFVVCNAAEGEPGTFKDRAIIRANPYQVVEGLAVAAMAIGATAAYVATKSRYAIEVEALEAAVAEMADAGMLEDVPLAVTTGPDEYLFGEEKALLEVVAGRDARPTLYPPYVAGLFGTPTSPNPTVVNNVETLAHVSHILREGAEWFRSRGTAESPGTMVFTVSGDVRREAVVELPLGTPLSWLVFGVGEGLEAGRRPKAVLSGVSNGPLLRVDLDTPLTFEALRRAGAGLGSGGFIVYDDTTCMAEVGAVLGGFLAVESCGQCPPCKLGTGALAERFDRIHRGDGDAGTLEELAAWTQRVTDSNRCGLGAAGRDLAGGIIERFWDELVAHLDGGCPGHRDLKVPKLDTYDATAGRFATS